MTEQEIIQGCRRQDRRAQKELWERYSPAMFGVCKRYLHHRPDAEDALMAAFYKVLTRMDSYGAVGSFEGWIRRIVVNECLMQLRRNHNFADCQELSQADLRTDEDIEAELQARELIALMEQLPTGYRTVFNMYVMEGYKHREIAEMLGISINTSKSQLILARKKLRELILAQQYYEAS